MQIAILTVSSLSLLVGCVSLAVMAKTANELKKAKAAADAVIETGKRNADILKGALGEMEL